MSNVKKFEEQLSTDEALQAKIKEATEAYKGDTTDGRATFDAIVAPIAAEAGLPFSYEEALKAAEGLTKRADEEFDDIGGAGFCIAIGFGEEPDACVTEEFGANGCLAALGVGLMATNDD